MECPKCGGPMWDNRDRKKTPKSPDFRCKDAECGHAEWIRKREPAPAAGAAPRVSFTWGEFALTFRRCYELAGKVLPSSDTSRGQVALGLFDQAIRISLKVRDQAPPASQPPPPPPPPDEVDDLPV